MATRIRIPTTDVLNVGNPPGSGGPLRAGGEPMPAGGPMRDSDLPSTLGLMAKKQVPALTLVRDLWCGNEKLHEDGETYLPRYAAEDAANYRVRLARATLFNSFRHTVNGLVGFVFRVPPKLGDDVPLAIAGSEEPDVEGLWENIDNAGTHGDVFARDIMADAMVTGHAAILVEYPNTGGTQDYAAELLGEVRPYWVPIKKENILSWRTVVERGKTVLTQLVLKECLCVPDGAFGDKMQTMYRVLYRENGVVGFRLLWITSTKAVVIVEEGTYPTQDEIPVAEVVTSGRCSMFESEPPLLDLAYLNLAHYRQWSDYDTSLRMTCMPLLFLAGFPTTDEQGNRIVIGANHSLNAPDPNAKAGYVTHSGQSLAECKASLDELQNQMGMLGLAALASQKRSAETATAKEIDKGASDSALAVAARGTEDGLERALYFTARYLGEEDGGSIEINSNFQDMTMDAQTMAAWGTLATALSLPAHVVIEALIEGGRLPEDTDIAALEQEMMANAQAEADQKALDLKMALATSAKRGAAPMPTPMKQTPPQNTGD